MPADCPGILIVQHMPEDFTALVRRAPRTALCKITVQGSRAATSRCCRATPTSRRASSTCAEARRGANYVTKLSTEPPVNRHRPSVDLLFRSAAKLVGTDAIGVILTGMGKDGAAGHARDEAGRRLQHRAGRGDVVVFGMPREAIACNGFEAVLGSSRSA